MGLFSKEASTKNTQSKKTTSGGVNSTFFDTSIIGSVKNALESKDANSSQNQGNGMKDNNDKKTKEPMAAGAVAGIISGVITSVSNIWTSSNQLKTKKSEADLIAKEIDLESEKGKSEALVAALAVKKAEVARLEAQDKANANVRGLIYGGLFILVGFIAYLMFSPKKQTTITQ